MYGWALIITVASVDTGFVIYAGPLINQLFHTNIVPTDPTAILIFTVCLLAVQTFFNIVGVNLLGFISKIGVYVEILGTFGVAVLLAVTGFHHGVDYLFSTQGAESAATNALGVDFGGAWWLGAAFVAILAHVYIFYGFESAGDVAEEVVQSSRRVPRAIISSLAVAGVTSFILVAALVLAVPSSSDGIANTVKGGVPFLISNAASAQAVQDIVLALVSFAFFSCGLAIQAAAARLIFSYARDRALPGSRALAHVSRRFRTPVLALVVAAVLPAAFAVLARFTPSSQFNIGFITFPTNVNALLLLVSFAVSGIYLSFLLVVLASLIAHIRGWRPQGVFRLGMWTYPVLIAGVVWLGVMLFNILIPSGITSPRGALFNYDWLTLLVMVVIILLGAIYFVLSRPARRIPVAVVPDRNEAAQAQAPTVE